MNQRLLPYLLLAPATIFLVVFFLWPFLLFLVWVVVISLRFGLARGRTPSPAAVAATGN